MDRYNDPEDAIPHELTVLVLTEADEIFGQDPVDIFESVRERLDCDRLLVEEHYRSLADLPDYQSIVQYPIWVVHHSCLFGDRSTALESYLRTASFPDETVVLALIDTDDERIAARFQEQIDTEYSDKLVTITSESALRHYLLGYLGVANPCSAAGLDFLVSWNNKISDTVGPR